MALNQARPWLVAYDIADERQLAHVHRFMLAKGEPMQYSLFRASMSTSQARALRRELERLIDASEDDVRMYPLPAEPEVVRIGRGDLRTEGIVVG